MSGLLEKTYFKKSYPKSFLPWTLGVAPELDKHANSIDEKVQDADG